ncbi:unnamed protein product [Bubo scandiacus]
MYTGGSSNCSRLPVCVAEMIRKPPVGQVPGWIQLPPRSTGKSYRDSRQGIHPAENVPALRALRRASQLNPQAAKLWSTAWKEESVKPAKGMSVQTSSGTGRLEFSRYITTAVNILYSD